MDMGSLGSMARPREMLRGRQWIPKPGVGERVRAAGPWMLEMGAVAAHGWC